MVSNLTIVSERENLLLSRKEIKCVFRGGNGFITRQGARDALADKLGMPKERIQIISLRGSSGLRDLYCDAFVFQDDSSLRRQVPSHLVIRMLSKEQRSAMREERKKGKKKGDAGEGKKKQEAGSQKSSDASSS
jgi:ribosomal protein S24E